jgi:hypothetical protein
MDQELLQQLRGLAQALAPQALSYEAAGALCTLSESLAGACNGVMQQPLASRDELLG